VDGTLLLLCEGALAFVVVGAVLVAVAKAVFSRPTRAQSRDTRGNEPAVSRDSFEGVPQRSLERRAPSLGLEGQSREELRALLAGREADASSLDLFYRVGVELEARGAWDDAMRAFAALLDASPNYRDARKRLEDIVRATGSIPEPLSSESEPSEQVGAPSPMRDQQRTMMGVAPSVVLGPTPPRDIPLPASSSQSVTRRPPTAR
jgi:hypothetical protein